jgi:hypothetical protein
MSTHTWGKQKSGRTLLTSMLSVRFAVQSTRRSWMRTVPGAMRSTTPAAKVPPTL